MELESRVAVITGAGGGIGRGCALNLARHGAIVAAVGWRRSSVEDVRDEILAAGGKCIAIETDIGDCAAVESMVDTVLREFGRVDMLVNSAARRARGPVSEMSNDEWQRVIEVNLTGAFYVTRAVARPMVRQRGGTMILFGSDRGIFGAAGGANYAAAKGGVIAYAKSLALELGPHQVTVNVLNPGTIPTVRPGISAEERAALDRHREHRATQDPLGRLNTVDDIAEYVRWLATTGGSFITGQLVTVRSKP